MDLGNTQAPNLPVETLSCVKDAMQCGVVSVSQDESVYKAIGLMVDKHLSGLPVVDGANLVGILSEKDVLSLLYTSELLTGTVADYMTKNVVTFSMEDSLEDVGKCFLERGFRRVAITCQDRLVGLLTRSDLIRHDKHRLETESWQRQATARDRLPSASDVMTTGLLTIREHTSLYEAASILGKKRVTGLPVVDEYMNLVGLLTEKDILKALYDPNTSGRIATDLMTRDVVSFSPEESIYDICQCLIDNAFRRVCILEEGKLVGIISRADLVVYILKNKSAIFSRRPKC